MEQVYKTALEIIFNMSKKDHFVSSSIIEAICETVLEDMSAKDEESID